jgi:hypothetical protein
MSRRSTDAAGGVGKADRAVDLLLAGATPAEVAAALSVHRTTIYRWLCDPEVVAELRRFRAARRFAAQEALQAASLSAIAALTGIIKDARVSPDARVRAACAVLDRAGITPRGAHEGATLPTPLVNGVETWQTRDEKAQADSAVSESWDAVLGAQMNDLLAAFSPRT